MGDQKLSPSSGNIFADIGLPNPEERIAKAQVVAVIDAFIRESNISQTEAARRMGLAQPDLSKMLRGKYRGFSLERLFGFLTALGYNVEVSITHASNENQEPGHLRLAYL